MILFILILFVIGWILTVRGATTGSVLPCGIFGFSGHRPVDETKLRWLAAENQSRGNDSMGVYGNNLFKDVGYAKNLIQTPGFRQAIKGAKTVQGHTRAATVGSVSKDNAHPFYFKEKVAVVGAHNGFVVSETREHHQKELGFEKDFDVDSMLIFAALAKHGDVNILNKIEMGAAISFTFPEIDPDVLYLYKREETRPLHIGESPDGIYYSSDGDPLRLIGCRTVWELLPNMLYTLNKGVITDSYRIADHVLKSLSANVQRLSWRIGIPDVELNALPVDVSYRAQHSATKKLGMGGRTGTGNTNADDSDDQFQHKLGFGNWKGYSKQDQANDRATIASKYENQGTTNSVEAKFKMLIANIRLEINNAKGEVLTPESIKGKPIDDMTCCLLSVTLKNKGNDKGLAAWSVLSDSCIDMCGLTSINGLTLIKIPRALCEVDTLFHVYDPIGQLGQYSFTVKPEIGRVMEVTLLIPFRQEEPKEEIKTDSSCRIQVSKTSSGTGSVDGVAHVSGNESECLHGPLADENFGVLRDNSPQVSGGHQRQQTIRKQTPKWDTTVLVPESDLKVVSDLEHRQLLMVPNIPSLSERLGLMDMTTRVTTHGTYAWNMPIPTIIWNAIIQSREYTAWYKFYLENYKEQLDAASLVLDAARLQARDRLITKCWYKLHIYIELLLRYRHADYVREDLFKTHPYFNSVSVYPSTILDTGYEVVEREVKKK